jgi:GTPase SAR1 family protein
MRFVVYGDTGSGKTALMVAMLYHYYLKGYTIYTNLDLIGIPHTKIDNINFDEKIREIDKRAFFDRKSVIAIDEVGEEQSGTPQITFSNMISQSRKTIGENHHLIMTTQTKYQTHHLLKSLIDYEVYPEIVLRSTKDNKPLIIRADYSKKIGRTYPPKFEISFIHFFKTNKTCDMYSTEQKAIPLQNDFNKKYIKKYKKYIGSTEKGVKKTLETSLIYSDGLNKTTAREIAHMIIKAHEIYPKEF